MPENENNYYYTQFATSRPSNYVELGQEAPAEKPTLYYNPRASQNSPGVPVDSRRSYVADKASQNRWNASRTRFAEMQQQLFDLGAYGEGANKDREVDGLSGNRTTAALARAKELGYNYDQATNSFKRVLVNKPETSEPAQAASTPLETRSRTVAQERVDSGVNRLRAGIQNRNIGEVFGGLAEGLRGRLGQSKLGALTSALEINAYDNMYPYSYGDMLVNTKTGEATPYKGGEVPEGFTLKQTWASTAEDEATRQAQQAAEGKSAVYKITNALKGKDPRKEYMEQMAGIDLSTAEGQRQWRDMVNNAPQGMVRLNGNPSEAQFEMRARLDQMNMYAGRPQQWNTYEVNPDYSSPTATARGSSTYRIADPEHRARINGQMSNYFLAHSKEGHWNDDHTAYLLPQMGYMGNQTLVADDEKGTNLRYGDWWDYTVDAPQARRFYTGDLLTEPGKTPTRNNYGRGNNSAFKTEGANDIREALVQSVKSDLGERFGNLTEGFRNAFRGIESPRLIARN